MDSLQLSHLRSPLNGVVLCCAKSLQSCSTLCEPVDCSPQGSSVHGFSRQEYWSGLPFPPPGYLPDPGMEPASLMSSALAEGFFSTSATWEAPDGVGYPQTQWSCGSGGVVIDTAKGMLFTFLPTTQHSSP